MNNSKALDFIHTSAPTLSAAQKDAHKWLMDFNTLVVEGNQPTAAEIADFEEVDAALLSSLQAVGQGDRQADDSGSASSKATISAMPPKLPDGTPDVSPAALDRLEAYLEAQTQTKDLHSKNGKYTPERRLLHERIIREELEASACIRRDEPIAIFTGGLPGSGKTTFIRKRYNWMLDPRIFKVEPDEIRGKLPEYKGWNAPITMEETSDITKEMLNVVTSSGCSYDVIFDGTMKNLTKYVDLIDAFHQKGYKVFLVYILTPAEVATERAMGRYQKTGRFVPRGAIKENYVPVFNQLKAKADGWILVDGVTAEATDHGGADLPADRDYGQLGSVLADVNPKVSAGNASKVKIAQTSLKLLTKALPRLEGARQKTAQTEIKLLTKFLQKNAA